MKKNQADNLEYIGFRRRFFPVFYWCLVLEISAKFSPHFRTNTKKVTENDSMTLKCIKKRLSCFLSKTAFNKFNKSVNSCFFVSAVSDNSDLCAAYDAEGKNAEK